MFFDSRNILDEKVNKIFRELERYSFDIEQKDREVIAYLANPKVNRHPFPETLVRTIRSSVSAYARHHKTDVSFSANRVLEKLLFYEKDWKRRLYPDD